MSAIGLFAALRSRLFLCPRLLKALDEVLLMGSGISFSRRHLVILLSFESAVCAITVCQMI